MPKNKIIPAFRRLPDRQAAEAFSEVVLQGDKFMTTEISTGVTRDC